MITHQFEFITDHTEFQRFSANFQLVLDRSQCKLQLALK